MHAEIWKPIPFFSKYQVSSEGRVRNDKKVLKQQDLYGYKHLLLVDDTGKSRQTRVHRLVCMAFHGIHPDYPNIQVNHKNGVRHDNHADNLEWCTQSENNIHAAETGLIHRTVKIRCTDIQSNETCLFHSLSTVTRFLGLKNDVQCRDIITRHKTTPYKGQYTFEVLRLSGRECKKTAVYAVDFTNNTFHQFPLMVRASYAMDKSCAAIRSAIQRDALLDGVYYWFKDDPNGFDRLKDFTDMDVARSLGQFEKRSNSQYAKFTVLNHTNQKTTTVNSIKEAASIVGVNTEQVLTHLKNRNGFPIMGFSVKREDDETPFPEYSREMVEASKRGIIHRSSPVRIINPSLGIDECWPSLHAFATAKALNHPSIKRGFLGFKYNPINF